MTAVLLERSTIPPVVFALIVLATAALFHWRSRRLILASLLAAVVSAVTFQIIGYFAVGYLDPFAYFALITSLIGAFVLALFVGFVIRYSRGGGT